MKKICIVIFLACFLSSIAWSMEGPILTSEQGVDPFAEIAGIPLSEVEMEEADGALTIFGVKISFRIKRFNRKQRTRNRSAVHCDIIAQNKADDLGLDTRSQGGKNVDYNNATVSDIYNGYPNNRHSSPPAGTSGYIFSSNNGTKEHLGVYQRKSGSNTYTRHANGSFAGTEHSYEANVGYTPQNVSSEVYVPLPKYDHNDLYYR